MAEAVGAPAPDVLGAGTKIEGQFINYGRDLPSDEEIGLPLRRVSEQALAFAKSFQGVREEVEADTKLSPEGKAEKIRDLGASWLVSETYDESLPGGGLAAMDVRVAMGKKAVAKLEAALTPFDPPASEDTAAALRTELRDRELREYVRSLPSKERSKHVLRAASEGDEATVRAVLSMPGALSGLTPEVQSFVHRAALERRHPAKLDRLRILSEAVGQAERNVRAASEVVRKLAGVPR